MWAAAGVVRMALRVAVLAALAAQYRFAPDVLSGQPGR